MGRVNGHSVEEVIAAVRNQHGLMAAVARELGVSRTTVWRYSKQHPTIRQAFDEERETLLDLAEKKLFEHVQRGSIPAIMFVLKTLGRTRGYVERQEVAGVDGEPLKVIIEYVGNQD